MLVGVPHKFYLIIIISRFIHIQWRIQVFCWLPGNPPPLRLCFFRMTRLLAPTFTGHSNLRLLDPPETNSLYATDISRYVMRQFCQPIILLLSCFLRQVSLYQQLILFVALRVTLLALLIGLLLEDNLWTGGMRGAEVTCSLFEFLFDRTSMSRRVVPALYNASRIALVKRM